MGMVLSVAMLFLYSSQYQDIYTYVRVDGIEVTVGRPLIYAICSPILVWAFAYYIGNYQLSFLFQAASVALAFFVQFLSVQTAYSNKYMYLALSLFCIFDAWLWNWDAAAPSRAYKWWIMVSMFLGGALYNYLPWFFGKYYWYISANMDIDEIFFLLGDIGKLIFVAVMAATHVQSAASQGYSKLNAAAEQPEGSVTDKTE
jgi:hypothetical protein